LFGFREYIKIEKKRESKEVQKFDKRGQGSGAGKKTAAATENEVGRGAGISQTRSSKCGLKNREIHLL